jgi:hypothetical protein
MILRFAATTQIVEYNECDTTSTSSTNRVNTINNSNNMKLQYPQYPSTHNRPKFTTLKMQFTLLHVTVTAALLTSTSAFFLRSKSSKSLIEICFPSSASMKVASMGFLSIPKPTYFQHVQCDARKERRSTRCSLSSTNTNDGSNKSGGDDSEVTETEGETNDNRMPYFFLYYTISMDGRQSRIMKIKISEGDDIDSIIDEIKKKGSPDFDSIPAYRIELYESFEQDEPLNSLEEWYPNVTWGTKQQPLIVKANPLIASVATTSPWKRSFGKCVFCTYV